MTVTPRPLDPAVELDVTICRIGKATAEYMVRLENILGSLKTLTTGAHGFDYSVSVTPGEDLRIIPLLADLTFDIESEFGVTIRTLTNAVLEADGDNMTAVAVDPPREWLPRETSRR